MPSTIIAAATWASNFRSPAVPSSKLTVGSQGNPAALQFGFEFVAQCSVVCVVK